MRCRGEGRAQERAGMSDKQSCAPGRGVRLRFKRTRCSAVCCMQRVGRWTPRDRAVQAVLMRRAVAGLHPSTTTPTRRTTALLSRYQPEINHVEQKRTTRLRNPAFEPAPPWRPQIEMGARESPPQLPLRFPHRHAAALLSDALRCLFAMLCRSPSRAASLPTRRLISLLV